MSNPDSFIDEVNEELKRDRLFGAIRKYGWIAVVAVIAIVGGAAWNEWRKASAEAEAQAFGDEVLTALAIETTGGRVQALANVEAEGDRAGILQLLLAAAEIADEDRDGALAALQEVENNTALPLSYRQIATLKRVMIGGSAIPLDERRNSLQGLAAPGGAFRPLALEQLALLTLEEGDREGALQQAQALLMEPELTPTLRQRVAQLIVVLGGDQPTDLG